MKTRIYAAPAVKGLTVNVQRQSQHRHKIGLKVIYHPLYSMNKLVTNKSKLPQDGAQVFPYMG